MVDEVKPFYLQPGTRIGFYEVVTMVGKGGFGALYKVLRDGQVFALKLSTFKFSDLSEEDRTHYMARAKREAGALMQLRHPNVVQVHGFEHWPDIENGYLYLVMDFVDGFQLYEWRRKQTPTLRQIALVFQKIALALNEVHRCEIYHRDLKSENVLIRRADGEPVLVDFGLARPRSTYTVTQANDIVGSHANFTPEYCKHFFSTVTKEHEKPFVHRPTTDLHALGYMLYEVLAGRSPFESNSENQIDLLVEIEQKVPLRPNIINSSVPGSLNDIAMKLLEKEPQNRFQTGSELGSALAKALEEAAESWDVPLAMPAPAKSNGPTRDVRERAPEASAQQEPEANSRISDTRVHPVEPPNPPPHADPRPGNQPLVERSSSSRNRTRTDSISKPAFSPPVAEKRAFVPPEAGPAEEPELPVGDLLTSALRKLPVADRAFPRRTKVALILVGLSVLLVAVLMTALLVAKRVKRTYTPENLLAKFDKQPPPAAADELGHEPVIGSSLLAPAVAPNSATRSGAPGAGTNRQVPNERGSRRGVAPDIAHKNSDEANIDALLTSTYGRPNIPEKGPDHRPASSDPPWLQRGHRIDTLLGKQTTPGEKKLGVPFGTHLRARLATNLDSRTIGDGPVEATLMRPFLRDGQAVLPSKTMLYGQARTSGGRFTVQFFRLRLPDNTEVVFSGLAVDIEDNKPGLAASGRIAAPPASSEGLASKLVKNTANTVLGKLSGDDATDIARGAGQTAVSHSDGTPSYSSSETLLLDAGRVFEVLVRETF